MGSQKENSQPEIIEGEQKWEQDFCEKFVKDVEDSGKVDWSKYTYTRNRLSPRGPALDLSKTKLLFISNLIISIAIMVQIDIILFDRFDWMISLGLFFLVLQI